MVKTWRWRLVLVASPVLFVAGFALLLSSRLAAPVASEGRAVAPGVHVTSHEPGAFFIQGLAVHPGPEVEALAAQLTPVAGPASLLAVSVSPAAAPGLAASPVVAAQDQ